MSAQVTITQLPTAGAITGTELVPIVQNGVTVQTTTGAIAASPSQTQTFLTQTQESSLPNSRYLSTSTGLTLSDGGAQSFYRINMDGAAASLNSAAGGIIVKNTGSTVIARQIVVAGSGLGVSNADGTGGNPTLQLTGIAASVAGLSGTGLLALTGGGTSISGRTLLGTANQISIANADGATGSPTFLLADNPILPGTGSVTIPKGSSAQQPVGGEGQMRFNVDSQIFQGYANGSWTAFSLAGGVSSFSGGLTGLTPASPSSGIVTLGGTLNVANGGTGASTLTGYVKGNGTSTMTASATIPSTDVSGLGTMSAQNANAVAITGGTIAGATITGGSVDSTPIGATVAAAGTFTSVTTTTGTISTAPTNPADLVNKLYVDEQVAAGIDVHEACLVESPIPLTVTYAQPGGVGVGVGATLTNAGTQAALVIDGVTMAVTNRVLIYTQANPVQNGVYTVTNIGSGSTNWVLTRSTDTDTYGSNSPLKLGQGSYFFIQSGATGAGESYVCNTVGAITFGSTAITFAQFSQSILYSAGTGLTLSSGYQFSITNTAVTAGTYGSASQVPVFAVNAQGQLTLVTNTSIAIAAGAVSGLAASATTDTTNAANITSGTLPTGRISGSYTGLTGVGTLTAGTWNGSTIGIGYGGTGLTATPTNGQLAIGNGSGYSLANLTAGTNVSISNTAGGITISATPSAGGTVTSVDMTVPAFLSVSGNPITTSGTLAVAFSGTALPVANGGTGAVSLAGYLFGNGTSAVTASTTIPSTAITGLGTMAAQDAISVAITGGTINGTSIGATAASTVRATTITTTGAGNPADGAGQIYLNGSASNRVEWAAVGTGTPAFTTRTDGTKLLLYPALSGSQVDYAFGISAGALWSSVPVNSSSFYFKWFGGETQVASLDGTGAFTAVGGISGGTF